MEYNILYLKSYVEVMSFVHWVSFGYSRHLFEYLWMDIFGIICACFLCFCLHPGVIFINNWSDILLYCNIIIPLHSRVLFKWSAQVPSISLMFGILCRLGCILTRDTHKSRYTSFLAVGVGLFLFVLTSFSDPGVVKSDNVSQYLSAYPYDNIIFSKKECPTCKIPKWALLMFLGF